MSGDFDDFKFCGGCEGMRHFEHFSASSYTKDKLQPRCKFCNASARPDKAQRNTKQRQYRNLNKEAINRKQREYRRRKAATLKRAIDELV